MSRPRLKCDGTRAESRFRLSAKRTSPFKSAGASVQSTTGSRSVRISGSNAGYTMFRGSVKSTGYPLHSPASPSLPLPRLTVCRHISTGLYHFPQICAPNESILAGGDWLPFILHKTHKYYHHRHARHPRLLYSVRWDLSVTIPKTSCPIECCNCLNCFTLPPLVSLSLKLSGILWSEIYSPHFLNIPPRSCLTDRFNCRGADKSLARPTSRCRKTDR
jgi:hypothetical protein